MTDVCSLWQIVFCNDCETSLVYSANCLHSMGRDGLVGIATTLRAGRSRDRIPVGARFSAPVQTGPGAHPASCTMGTGYFGGEGVKRPGRGADHPPQSKCRVLERVGLYLCSPSGLSWRVIGRTFTFTFTVYTVDNRHNLHLQTFC